MFAGCPPLPHTAASQVGHTTAPLLRPSRPATCDWKLLTSWTSLWACPASELVPESSKRTRAGGLPSAALSSAAGASEDPANLQDTDSLAPPGLFGPKVCSRQPEASEAKADARQSTDTPTLGSRSCEQEGYRPHHEKAHHIAVR